MLTTHTPETLRAFTASIAEEFNRGTIPGPVHLSGGNEENLIEIFRGVGPEDFVFSTWRSHYHCLLRGVPEEELRREILAGRSITLQFPQHRILTSAIVAGALPIAVGVALQIKRSGGSERVWAFMGDMCSATGLASECVRYASAHHLPITFVTEDNSVSVCTPTREAWGNEHLPFTYNSADGMLRAYKYVLPFAHAGAKERINF